MKVVIKHYRRTVFKSQEPGNKFHSMCLCPAMKTVRQQNLHK